MILKIWNAVALNWKEKKKENNWSLVSYIFGKEVGAGNKRIVNGGDGEGINDLTWQKLSIVYGDRQQKLRLTTFWSMLEATQSDFIVQANNPTSYILGVASKAVP